MKLGDMDIVYVVKDSAYNEELRYSLRSVEKNFPHKRVWFYGGKPMYLHPDEQAVIDQKGKTKWDKVRSMLISIAKDDRITEDFILFNDDFFVMKPVASIPVFYYDTLGELCNRVERKNGDRPTPYTIKLKETARILENDGKTSLNYELHVPMVFNRKKLLEIVEKYPGIKGTRSLYGNTFMAEFSKYMPDVKIFDSKTMPKADSIFLSTEDISFNKGKVGEYIRQQFPFKSKWEK